MVDTMIRLENIQAYIDEKASIVERIPRIWKLAYLLMVVWYAINYVTSAVSEYFLFRPYPYVLWNGLYLFEALCIFIILIFLYANWLVKFKAFVQVIGHVGGIISYFIIMGSLSYYFDAYLDGARYIDDWQEYMTNLMSWQAMRFHDQYIITVAMYYLIRYFTTLQRKEYEKSQLALKNKEMQISLLKSQINPHFLFNTLNSISMLMSTSKEKARRVITQLSDIFRYALDSHTDQFVKLSDEILFIENYVKIQQVRFGDRLNFVLDIEPTCLGVKMPPMVLQPLIENAVKYGIAPKDEGGTIQLRVQHKPYGISFEVTDDGLGINAKKVLDGSSSGVGLKNCDRRLKNIYGKAAGLRVKATEGGFRVQFTIPKDGKPLQEPTDFMTISAFAL
jgi:two-component system, LytTR family, sensor kinase